MPRSIICSISLDSNSLSVVSLFDDQNGQQLVFASNRGGGAFQKSSYSNGLEYKGVFFLDLSAQDAFFLSQKAKQTLNPVKDLLILEVSASELHFDQWKEKNEIPAILEVSLGEYSMETPTLITIHSIPKQESLHNQLEGNLVRVNIEVPQEILNNIGINYKLEFSCLMSDEETLWYKEKHLTAGF